MKKILTISATALFILTASATFAFDWPQNAIQSDSFYSYFGQIRGGTINASLIFTDSEEIKAADNGKVIGVISEHSEESELFESTLGNALIVAHKDDLQTVYANLDRESQRQRYALDTVKTGTIFGVCGNTGWQQGQANLEFQVVDTKNQVFINPRVLMPRVGKELELTIQNVTAVSRKGNEYTLGINKRFPSGTYYLYRKRQEIAMPYRTTIFINGAAVETISYDMLTERNGRLCTNGNKNYPVTLLYPDLNRQLLADISLPKGHNVISIVATDILGKEVTLTYSMDAY
ncbi:MAG: M23 family metallopeptidase [Treponema sp.]|nr:M23 family metallopeptidase [Treponema sp.]